MTYDEEKQLLREVHENNIMLRSLVNYVNSQTATKDIKNFSINLLADIIGEKIK